MSRFIPPYPDYDIRGTESWLEEMALKGHFLEPGQAFRYGFANFVRGNPQRVRYRLVPPEGKRDGRTPAAPPPSEEQLRRMEDFGWHYVTYRGQYHIYACSDPNAPDMNTDPRIQAIALEVTWKRMKRWMWFLLFMGLLNSRSGNSGVFFFTSLVRDPAASWLYPRLIFLGLLCVGLLPELFYLMVFRKKLQAGILPEPEKPLRRWISYGVNLLPVIPFVFVFLAPILLPDSPVHPVEKIPMRQAEALSLVTIGDLYPEAQVRYLSADEQADYRSWSTEFTSSYQILGEHFRLTLPDNTQCSGRWTVHRCDTAQWAAVGYARELRLIFWIGKEDTALDIDLPGWDYASVFQVETPSTLDTDKLVLLLAKDGVFFRAELTLFSEDSGKPPTPEELAALLLASVA